MTQPEDHFTPLDRNSFALEFNTPGSTIRRHDRYALHARQILVDERNYLGLFALDALLENKVGQYRKCGVTPKANHPLLAFYQIHAFHDADKQNADNPDWIPFLPDRPDLDEVLALLHDEGEETEGFTEAGLKRKMHDFLKNIEHYIHEHNALYPMMPLDIPSNEEIEKMRSYIFKILPSFDLITRGYKGEKKKDDGYFPYHVAMLDDGRSCRVKAIDKICNAATFSFRNQKLLDHNNNDYDADFAKYRKWAESQINKMRDIYIDHPFTFTLTDNFTRSVNDNEHIETGFIAAAAHKHPRSMSFFEAMQHVIEAQLRIYNHDLANEGGEQNSPLKLIRPDEYDSVIFAKSVNVIDIQLARLEETNRLDQKRLSRDPTIGMFDIPFPIKAKRNRDFIISPHP